MLHIADFQLTVKELMAILVTGVTGQLRVGHSVYRVEG